MAAGIVSAVSRECSVLMNGARLLRPGILTLKLCHFSSISRCRMRNVCLRARHCVSYLHSAGGYQTKVTNLWDEYSRVKSYVEGKFHIITALSFVVRPLRGKLQLIGCVCHTRWRFYWISTLPSCQFKSRSQATWADWALLICAALSQIPAYTVRPQTCIMLHYITLHSNF